MAFQKKELNALQQFLPENCFEPIVFYLNKYSIQLSITQQRKTIHGNYKYDFETKKNRISVNGNLNIYAFLITLIHEIAHCVCLHEHGHRVPPHGAHWQQIYRIMLKDFVALNIFPQDILAQLQKTIQNPKASTCADPALEKILVLYNAQNSVQEIIYVEDVPEGAHFATSDDKIFKRLQKRRTRYLCENYHTKQQYLFPSIYQIKKIIHDI
jgi:SprT protein